MGVAIWMTTAAQGWAHVSEQGFVLLLPTDIYILAGTACVALTVLLLAVLPRAAMPGVFRAYRVLPVRAGRLALATSCASFCFLLWLIWVGHAGPRDPLANPLTLTIWTLWWIGFVTLQGLLGNLWRFVNPWTGPVAAIRCALSVRPFLRLPGRLGHGIAILGLLGFAAVLLADPAPADPARLAGYVGGYWLFTFVGLLAFGPRWAARADWVGMLMRCYARVGIFGRTGGALSAGLSGWQVLARRAPAPGVAVFMLLLLGIGSFDGLNETFWWFALLGINPLEFPGRSAVIWQNLTGLVIANMALVCGYGVTIWLGLRLAGQRGGFGAAFCLFAPTILPIALGYHLAHYLTSFLVDSQYALAAASDPMARGADYLGLGTFYVTTSFFNTAASVRVIWLSQAGVVVLGHVLAVMLAHALALRQVPNTRQAVLSQAPLAVFMVLYTLFGLWLLASPRGA